MGMQGGFRIGIGLGLTDALPRDGQQTTLSPVGVTSATKKVWYDPTDDTYVTLASGDTIFSQVLNKFLLGGNDGSLLTSRSGNSVFGVATVNGLRTMQAGATNQAMASQNETAASIQVGSNSVHIFCVSTADFTTLSTAGLAYTLANKGSTDRWRMQINTNLGVNTSRWGFTFDDGPTAVQAYAASNGSWNNDGGKPHLFEIQRHNTDGVFRSFVDGVQTSSAAIPGGFGDIDDITQTLILGAAPGAGTATAQWWNGKIGDFVMFQGEISAEELTMLRAWFVARWGIV
jgi:hypothetical protein